MLIEPQSMPSPARGRSADRNPTNAATKCALFSLVVLFIFATTGCQLATLHTDACVCGGVGCTQCSGCEEGALAIGPPACAGSPSYSAGFRDGFADCSSALSRVEWAAGFQDGFESAQQRHRSCTSRACDCTRGAGNPDVWPDTDSTRPQHFVGPSTPVTDQPMEVLDSDPHFELRQDEFIPLEAPDDSETQTLVPEPAVERPDRDYTDSGDVEFSPADSFNEPDPFQDEESDEERMGDFRGPSVPGQPAEGSLDAEEPEDTDVNFDDLFLDETGSLPAATLRRITRRDSMPQENSQPQSSTLQFRDNVSLEERTARRNDVQRASHQAVVSGSTRSDVVNDAEASEARAPSRSTSRERGSAANRTWRGFSALSRHRAYPNRSVTTRDSDSSYHDRFSVDQTREVVIKDLGDD